MKRRFLSLFFWFWLVAGVESHARLYDPPGRGTMWRHGHDVPINYSDHGLNCGGVQNQKSQGGKCGLCGDPYNGELKHEAGGKYATDKIAACLSPSQRTLDITVMVTANHLGYFEFHLCPNNDYTKKFTQDCLDRYPLRISGTADEYRNYIGSQKGPVTTTVDLPAGLTCSQCVVQWHYVAGNTWGTDPDTGKGCVGCGQQEEFVSCSDIKISDDCGGGGQDIENNQPQTTKQPQTQQPWTQRPATQAATPKPWTPQPWTPKPWTQRPVTQAATQQPWTQRPATQAATPRP